MDLAEGVSTTGGPGRRASRMLAVYLRNHEAAAQGGAELFRRMASSQRRRPWGPELEDLTADVVEDLRSLRALLRGWRVSPDPWAGLTVKLGERVGRLKPNGHLVSRSPLSDLVEVEAGLDAVHAKAAGWQALLAAMTPTPSVDLDDLARRAEDQVARLRAVHVQVAATVL